MESVLPLFYELFLLLFCFLFRNILFSVSILISFVFLVAHVFLFILLLYILFSDMLLEKKTEYASI